MKLINYICNYENFITYGLENVSLKIFLHPVSKFILRVDSYPLKLPHLWYAVQFIRVFMDVFFRHHIAHTYSTISFTLMKHR